MKNPMRFAGLLGVVAIVAAACGGGNPSTGPTSGASAPGGTTPPANPAAYPEGPVSITLWTKEGEADGALQYAKKLAADYKAVHGNVTITVVNKDREKSRR